MDSHPSVASSWRRQIGSFGGTEPGQTLVAVCSIHGNEPAGFLAAEIVFRKLQERAPGFRGEFVAIGGNLAALAANKRYLDRDLNRQWGREQVASARQMAESVERAAGARTEAREQIEILAELESVLSRSSGPAIFLDLHTSSADGPPFGTMGDTLRNRAFVASLPIPVIMGLEEMIDGALLEYINNLGHITVGVEGGRHDRETSIENHEAILWLSLIAAGCIDECDVPEAAECRERLIRATREIPHIVEVRYRHVITEEDQFRMKPGFFNFHPIAKSDLLATDRQGDVRAKEAGLVLLPLYQGLGDDGFFLAREVKQWWLSLSASVRKVNLHWVTDWLPGVRRHPDEEGTLIVDLRIARFFPIDIFHLLGYRKRRFQEGQLLVTRRRKDLR